MRDTRVHLNNFYICGATNQEINVTPFTGKRRRGAEEAGERQGERTAYKIKQMGCGGVAVAACLDIPLNSAVSREGKYRKRERIPHE